MSSSKLDTSGVFQSANLNTHQTQLTLPRDAVRIHKGGIEFRVSKPLSLWKEMTVELQSLGDTKKAHFSGVVVACDGTRQSGYLVSMVITNVSRQSQERLNLLASPH